MANEETVLRDDVHGARPASYDAPLDTNNARLRSVGLAQAAIVDSRWQATTVTGSDLSRASFDSSRLLDVVFDNCDLTGLQMLGRTTLEIVTFSNCKLAYSNWFDVNLDRVRFVQCQLRDARFASLSVSEVQMLECDLSGASFDGLLLEEAGDLDVRGSTIEATTGLAHTRGLRVDTLQAAALAAGLLEAHGIVVDDFDPNRS